MDGGAHYSELEKDPQFAIDDESLLRRKVHGFSNGNLFTVGAPMICLKEDDD